MLILSSELVSQLIEGFFRTCQRDSKDLLSCFGTEFGFLSWKYFWNPKDTIAILWWINPYLVLEESVWYIIQNFAKMSLDAFLNLLRSLLFITWIDNLPQNSINSCQKFEHLSIHLSPDTILNQLLRLLI